MRTITTIVFVAFATLCLAQGTLVGDDLVTRDTVYVVFDSGEIESVVWYRTNYVEESAGGKTLQRGVPKTEADYIQELNADKERWTQLIANIDSDIARLELIKAWYEGVITEIETKLSEF